MFLSPNVISLCPSMDQGVITKLKKNISPQIS